MASKWVKWVLGTLILGLCLVISLPLRAQVSGATVSGVITDAQGGAVPNAKITITNVATSVAVGTTRMLRGRIRPRT